jgi:hypothetical protein
MVQLPATMVEEQAALPGSTVIWLLLDERHRVSGARQAGPSDTAEVQRRPLALRLKAVGLLHLAWIRQSVFACNECSLVYLADDSAPDLSASLRKTCCGGLGKGEVGRKAWTIGAGRDWLANRAIRRRGSHSGSYVELSLPWRRIASAMSTQSLSHAERSSCPLRGYDRCVDPHQAADVRSDTPPSPAGRNRHGTSMAQRWSQNPHPLAVRPAAFADHVRLWRMVYTQLICRP